MKAYKTLSDNVSKDFDESNARSDKYVSIGKINQNPLRKASNQDEY